MKWYTQKYVNRRDWILDNLEFLKLSPSETAIVLLIDFFNANNIDITIELLSKKTDLSLEEVNKVLGVLFAKKYLIIEAKNKKAKFNLNNLFEIDVAQTEFVLDSSLFQIFENEFKRPLNHNEMEKISDWARFKDKSLILNALKEASIYKKLSISYVEKVLKTLEEKRNKEFLNND